MISFKHRGSFFKTKNSLKKMVSTIKTLDLDKYGQEGVNALMLETPKDTGLLASSWYYKIIEDKNSITIQFCNSDIESNIPVAIILFYGHGTKSGGWVQGIDYINPALRPVFNKILMEAWEEVRNS